MIYGRIHHSHLIMFSLHFNHLSLFDESDRAIVHGPLLAVVGRAGRRVDWDIWVRRLVTGTALPWLLLLLLLLSRESGRAPAPLVELRATGTTAYRVTGGWTAVHCAAVRCATHSVETARRLKKNNVKINASEREESELSNGLTAYRKIRSF